MKLAHAIGHIFVPRTSNNHKAKIIQSSGLLLLLTLYLSFQFAIQLFSNPNVGVLGYAANISPTEVVRLTNEKRLEAGVGSLQYSDVLSEAAHQKGEDMLEHDYWAHVSPSGVEPWSFFVNVGYKYRYAGENLARDFTNPQAAVDAWMASATHKENLLSPKYQDIGVAVVEGDLGGADATIIVQLFGTKADSVASTISVASAQTLNNEQTPSPSPEPVVEKPAVESDSSLVPTSVPSPSEVESPFNVARVMSLITVIVLMVVFIADIIIIKRKNVVRPSSRIFAHISFLGMIIAILLIVKAGSIL